MPSENQESLTCWVYRSARRDEMYLYLAEENGFDEVPAALMRLFGSPTLVMHLELNPRRPLAREDIVQVMANLREQGFHLQMPPVKVPDPLNA